ncbi:unnamed protein product [Phytophthora fragariaefolia]|uniref:Unnamed protein product n=1 Tax=Phytophthora fragariaefolia TaxID=1490495 RepID=A0A9W7D2U1_9STRA|nr:unnamed protein product [Phytophthora fragariaefolia]GMF54379.1 unnamed protein product [Phytophthora fragariaefolia]
MQFINKCTCKVTAYQARKPGTLEMQLALEIVGVGVFANSTIALMRKWHTAEKSIKKIKRALTWIERLDFTRHGNSSFYVEDDPVVPTLLEGLPILSNECADMVELATKETLSAQVMQMILHKIFGADSSVRILEPSNLGISNRAITTDSGHFKRALAGVTNKMKILFQVNCNNNHWCAVLTNLEKGRMYVYDSMASSYAASIRAVAQQMTSQCQTQCSISDSRSWPWHPERQLQLRCVRTAGLRDVLWVRAARPPRQEDSAMHALSLLAHVHQ